MASPNFAMNAQIAERLGRGRPRKRQPRERAGRWYVPTSSDSERTESLDRNLRKVTMQFLQANLDGIDKEFSSSKPLEIPPDVRASVISDTHFDHGNIIRYCHRPYRTVALMNQDLERKWNAVVGQDDMVFFLGDLCFGRGRHPIDYWLTRLNGRIFFIRGNHDSDPITKAVEIPNNFVIRYRGESFLLSHEPLRPRYWKGWIIHGDKHNSDIEIFPFINGENETINASAELVGYSPVSLDHILQLNLGTLKRMDTISSQRSRK